jgi:hypothetical protein
MNPWPGKRTLVIVTACLNAGGEPDLTLTEVDVTYAEYADGVHCERVEEQLVAAGYEEPFLHFDEGQPSQFLVPAVRQYLATANSVPEPMTAHR